jgi:GLPGLI family protein
MKKAFLTCTLFISIVCLQSFGQAPDTLRAKVTYAFSHIQDTTQKDKPFKEQMVLLLGQNSSVYFSLDKAKEDEQRKLDIAQQVKNAVPGNMSINVKSGNKKLNGSELYLFTKKKQSFSKQRMVNNYLIAEPFPVMNWKISNDTLNISGLACQKATTEFKGRNYTAWFCPDLPFSSGPWKLNGLPGLIVEAYDTDKEVVFKFDGFEQVNNANNVSEGAVEEVNGIKMNIKGLGGDLLKAQTIVLPADGIRTTQKEFNKLKEAMRKDPQGFINSSFAGTGSMIRATQSSKSRAPGTANISAIPNMVDINNPIELPEIK